MKWLKIGKGRRLLLIDETSGRDKATELRRTGQLPVEAQVFLRVMGEDLPAARELLAAMPPLERAIMLFWIEQIAGLVYELDEREVPEP